MSFNEALPIGQQQAVAGGIAYKKRSAEAAALAQAELVKSRFVDPAKPVRDPNSPLGIGTQMEQAAAPGFISQATH